MKLRIIIIALLMAMKFCINAQTYKPFPTDSAIWGFYYTSQSGNVNTKEIIKGDTLLGGNSYIKVYSHTNALIGFYRENSKKILAKVISYYDTSEILIYNYNLNLGDTFYDKRTNTNYKYLLNSITTSTLTSDLRKQYNFSYVGQSPVTTYSNLGVVCNFYWVEGIGSLKGIFNNRSSLVEGTECPLNALISNASNATLKCFEHKNIQYMPQSCLTLDIKPFNNNSNFKIYPNPANELLNVDLGILKNIDTYKIEITNTLGQIVQTSNIQHQTTALNISELQNGIYFLQVFYDTKLIGTTKIVKQ